MAIRFEGAQGNGFPALRVIFWEMNAITKYAAVSAILLSATGGVSALGLAAAGDLFARSSPQELVAVVSRAEMEHSIGKRPTSSLLGAKAEQTAEAGSEPTGKGRWVEVVDAVNMRKGPASATEVIKVQLPGAKLRVASREGAWVEVLEPKTGGTGWVFEKFVKHIDPVSRRAEAGETAIR